MSADDITLGGRAPGSPRIRSADRPTAPIDCSAHHSSTIEVVAPRAIDLDEAQQHAADILSGRQGYMAVGRPGIEELAWFVARITAVSVADPEELTLDVEIEIDVDDLVATG